MNHHETMIDLLKRRFGDSQITGIEIGTGGGGLPASVMLLCPNVKRLITIDPWMHKDGVEFESGWEQKDLDATREIAYKRLEEYKDRCAIYHMESDAAFEIIDEQVDFVWIDGDHTQEQVKRDLRFEKFVKPEGIIGGHDFGQVPLLTEVIRAKYGEKINTGEDFTWWVYL